MKKRRFISLALALLTVLGTVSAASVTTFAAEEDTERIDYFEHEFKTQEEKLATMELMLSLYGYELYFERTTGEVAYRNTETGAITFTNPYDVSKSGGGGSADTKSMLLSQILLTYTDNGKTVKMYSYTEASLRDQINVKYVKNGIRVEYAMGRVETRRLLPRVIEKSKFEELIMANISSAEHHKYVGDFYTLEDPSGKSQQEIDEMNARVPITKDMAVYVLQSDTTEREMNVLESYIKLYCPDFTYELLAEIHNEVQYVGTDNDPPLFRLSLEYYLDEYGLQVRLPANGIRFNESRFTLDSIQILPYLGAAAQDYEGYTLFPDGSGSLIRFEDLTSALTLSGKLYGPDFSYQDVQVPHSQTLRMPVFGVVENYYSEQTRTEIDADGNVNFITDRDETDRGHFVIIEDGESLASITSEHGANATHRFNSAYTTFTPRPKDTYSLANAISVNENATWTVVSKRKYTGSYTLRVIQLNDPKNEELCKQTKFYESSYVGMANAYRDYLERTGKITRLEAGSDIPLYIESFGELDSSGTFLTFPITVKKALTTTDDIKSMYDWFSEKGISNIHFRLKGFGEGGMLGSYAPYHANFQDVVGGNSGMSELADYAAEKGFAIYPDFDFTYVSADKMFDEFTYKKDAVKSINGLYSTKLEYSMVDQSTSLTGENLITSASFKKMYTSLSADLDKLFGDTKVGISAATLGSDINSDFDTADPYNREDSKLYIQNVLSAMAEKHDVMIDAGNSFAVPYATHILNAPLDSSHFTRANESVPFFGLVYHGYVNYAGTPTNMAGDTSYEKLKMIENGANPYFTLSCNNTTMLKDYFRLAKYYSVSYENWRDDVVDIYNEINEILGPLQNKIIVNHEFIDSRRIPAEKDMADFEATLGSEGDPYMITDGSVVRVTYEGGVSYLLNYNYFDVTADGVTVPAMSYIKQ